MYCSTLSLLDKYSVTFLLFLYDNSRISKNRNVLPTELLVAFKNIGTVVPSSIMPINPAMTYPIFR